MLSPSDKSRESFPDYLSDGLDIVFAGVPAIEEMDGAEHHHAGLHDRFWDLVNESELVSDIVGAENDHLILDEKCGLTMLAKKRGVEPNMDEGYDIDGFVEKMERSKPKVVALIGERAYREVFRQQPRDFGLTDDIIGDSYVFLLPSSDERDTSLAYQKKLHWYKKLKATLRTL